MFLDIVRKSTSSKMDEGQKVTITKLSINEKKPIKINLIKLR